jgi:5'-phosphate synthase pdxT subunit
MHLTAGVVAVQGDVSEHTEAIRRAATSHGHDVEVHEIRTSGTIPECDLLLLPGGESTTISRHLQTEDIAEEILDHTAADKPVLATCAGLIISSRDPKDDRVAQLDILNVTVDRNAFGRQADSFEAPLEVTGLDAPFPAVFIRAPVIDQIGSSVEILATWDGRPVAVRDGPIVATSFHPELTDDPRIHDLAFFENAAAETPPN